LTHDPEQHAAFYGARLIFEEVASGFGGIVYNRQTPEGDEALINERIFPHYDEFMDLVRLEMDGWPMLSSGSRDVVQATFGDDVVFAASPQGSYGYLYLSAVVLKESN
jgi:hypothetical protein